MVLKAIMDQLATGTIPQIYTRGNYEIYMAGRNSNDLLVPYVVVYDDYPINVYFEAINSISPFAIEAHYPVGNMDKLNEYIEYELSTLLNRKRLVDGDGYSFQVYVTMNISVMAEPNDDKSISGGNDDGTISRYRRIFIPRRGL